MDQEITGYVLDWGRLDEVKTILLAQSQMFVGQMNLTVDNALGIFSPSNTASPLRGNPELNQGVTIFLNGVQVFSGILKTSESNYDGKTAVLTIENQFSKMASTACIFSQASVNPAIAILSMLTSFGFGSFLNQASFLTAAGPSLNASAVVSLSYGATDKVYILQAVNEICELASLVVFAKGTSIFCNAFTPYPGGESNLRQEMNQSNIRIYGKRRLAYNTFYNQVIVPWTSGQVQVDDTVSQNLTDVVSSKTFSTATGRLTVPNANSASFFAKTFLSKSSVKEEITLSVGVELSDVSIGNRHPVTAPLWGYSRKPFEIIETRKTLADKGLDLVLASI